MKNNIICFLIGAGLGLAAFCGVKASAAQTVSATYPQTFVVDSVDYTADSVTLRTSAGFLFQFSGVEDWAPGDMAAAIMDDNGTPEIFDDIILRTRYTGAAEWFY